MYMRNLLNRTKLGIVTIFLFVCPVVSYGDIIVDGIGPDDSNGTGTIDWGCPDPRKPSPQECSQVRPPDSSLLTKRFKTIQSAVTATNLGLLSDSTVIVLEGIYSANDYSVPSVVMQQIYIDSPIMLKASGNVYLEEGDINITSPSVTIEGFNITNVSIDLLISSAGVVLSDNTIEGDTIFFDGPNGVISGNTLNDVVILLSSKSKGLTITENTFTDSSFDSLPYLSDCVVKNNTFSSGIVVFGTDCDIQNNIFNDVTLNNLVSPLSFSVMKDNNFQGGSISFGSNCGDIAGNTFSNHYINLYGSSCVIKKNSFSSEGIVINGSDNVINQNVFRENSSILIYSSQNNTITNNEFHLTDVPFELGRGISLMSAEKNTISNNLIDYEGKYISGITLLGCSNNSITNNNLANIGSEGYVSINIAGAEGFTSNNNVISYNTLTDTGLLPAINILGSDSNLIENNIITTNKQLGIGIHIYYSKDNTLINNKLKGQSQNLSVFGLQKEEFRHNINTSNTADDLPIYYYYDKNDLVISELETKHITVAASSNVTINNIKDRKMDPVTIAFTDNSIIENTDLIYTWGGFLLIGSNNNKIRNNKNVSAILLKSDNNILSENNILDLYLGNPVGNCTTNEQPLPSKNNLIYNNIFNYSDYVREECGESQNTWNIEKTIGTNIVGGPYKGGNFWFEYNGKDNNGDGIGDTVLPYNAGGNIINGGDWLPLVKKDGGICLVAPDLVVIAVSDPPAQKKSGSSFTVTDTTKNQGTKKAGKFVTRYYLSVDNIKDDNDILLEGKRTVKALKPGKSSKGKKKVTIPENTSQGSYYLIACADDRNNVAECDEDNNCMASSSTIEVK